MDKKLNKNLVKVVSILNDGEYHDGTTMGEKLQMTRSAVWKTIKKLQSYQIKIDSIKGKGYALLEPLILLDCNKIKKNITYKKIDLKIFESLESTNEYLKEFKDSDTIKICLAEQQTHGKGRLNREWHSPFGKNIYLSCLYPFKKDVSELSGLSLVMCLAVVKTLRNCGIYDSLYVKWPNDIVYSNKKLSGGLIEIQAETHGTCQAVIGIGINVNMLSDNNKITQAWTSLQKILNKYVDRNHLSINLINNLIDYLYRFDEHGFPMFIQEWINADCLSNQVITVKNMNQHCVGKVTGINEQGHLMLSMGDGTVRAFSSGDTSIVKDLNP